MSALRAASDRILEPPPPMMTGISETGLGRPVDRGYVVVLAIERKPVLTPEPPHNVDRLSEALDPSGGVDLGDARDRVVALRPAGANAEKEPPVRQEIDGRALLGEEDRIAKATPATWGPTFTRDVAQAAVIIAGIAASWLPKWSSMWKLK